MASTEKPAATPEKPKSTKKKRKTAPRAAKKKSSTTRKATTPSAAPKRKRSTRRTTGAEQKKPATLPSPSGTGTIRTEAPAGAPISPFARQRMIAEAAYYKAQSRGFAGGNPEQDWLEAEAEIDGRLTR